MSVSHRSQFTPTPSSQEFSPRVISSCFYLCSVLLTGTALLCLRGAVGAFRRRPFVLWAFSHWDEFFPLSLSLRTRHPSRSVSLSQTCRYNPLLLRVCQLFTDSCQLVLWIEQQISERWSVVRVKSRSRYKSHLVLSQSNRGSLAGVMTRSLVGVSNSRWTRWFPQKSASFWVLVNNLVLLISTMSVVTCR